MHSVLWRNHVSLLRAVRSSQCQPTQQIFQTFVARQSVPKGPAQENKQLHGGNLWYREIAWGRKIPGLLPSSHSMSTAEGMNPLQQTPQMPLESDPGGTAVASYVPLRSAFALRKSVKISPKKLNVVARLVRRMHVEDAFSQCSALPKKAARIVAKTLQNACYNAVNNFKMNSAILHVDECFVMQGKTLKGYNIHGRGKAGVRRRYYSHLKIVVAEKLDLERSVKYQSSWRDRNEGRRGRGTGATFVARKIQKADSDEDG